MIIVVSSSNREASVFTTLCEFRHWPSHVCLSVAEFLPLAQRIQPLAVLIRHQLEDGYSDDILAQLHDRSLAQRPKALVLMAANCSFAAEARQVALGAEVVMRDPVRIPVMLEYLSRFHSNQGINIAVPPTAASWTFAGAEVFPLEHRLAANGRSVHLAPQEVALLEILRRHPDTVVTYQLLYDDLFNRRYSGETGNSRVLLGKTNASFRKVGVDLRKYIQVVPKSGYLYNPSGASAPKAPVDLQVKRLSVKTTRRPKRSLKK